MDKGAAIATGALFTADCFGALLPAVPEYADDVSDGELRAGPTLWVTIDSPWIHKVDRTSFSDELSQLRGLEPNVVLSGHLPPASGSMLGRLVDALDAAPDAAPFAGPDQQVLQQMMAELAATA
jgi:hypothetical protein